LSICYRSYRKRTIC